MKVRWLIWTIDILRPKILRRKHAENFTSKEKSYETKKFMNLNICCQAKYSRKKEQHKTIHLISNFIYLKSFCFCFMSNTLCKLSLCM